jgi:hypothetical protein
MGRECALLGGKDLSLQFNGLRLEGGSIAQTYHRWNDFARSLQGTSGSSYGAHISDHASSSNLENFAFG